MGNGDKSDNAHWGQRRMTLDGSEGMTVDPVLPFASPAPTAAPASTLDDDPDGVHETLDIVPDAAPNDSAREASPHDTADILAPDGWSAAGSIPFDGEAPPPSLAEIAVDSSVLGDTSDIDDDAQVEQATRAVLPFDVAVAAWADDAPDSADLDPLRQTIHLSGGLQEIFAAAEALPFAPGETAPSAAEAAPDDATLGASFLTALEADG